MARNQMGRRLVLRGDDFFNELSFHRARSEHKGGEYERKERVNGREKSGGANERRGGSDSKRPEKNFSSTAPLLISFPLPPLLFHADIKKKKKTTARLVD